MINVGHDEYMAAFNERQDQYARLELYAVALGVIVKSESLPHILQIARMALNGERIPGEIYPLHPPKFVGKLDW